VRSLQLHLRREEKDPKDKIDAMLKGGEKLRISLKYPEGYSLPSEKQRRIAVLKWMTDAHAAVEECAPAYLHDFYIRGPAEEGAPNALEVLEDSYVSLAQIRKQL
jgi:hypothetical protein